MALEWHGEPRASLEACPAYTVYQERPAFIKELGYVTKTHQNGQTSRELRQVRLESQHSRNPVEIDFLNASEKPIRLIWLNYRGHEVAYLLLEPNYLYSQGTFQTHPWIARATDTGKRMLIDNSEVYLPTETAERVEITSPPRLEWTLETHRYFPTEFKSAIKCFLLCYHVHRRSEESPSLPQSSFELSSPIQTIWRMIRPRKDTKPTLLQGLGRLPPPLALKIVAHAAEEVYVEQTLLKGLQAGPDLAPYSLRHWHHLGATPSKLCSADEAVALISNHDTFTVSGFVGSGCPEELLVALGRRFDETGYPHQLNLITGIVVGNGKGRGMDILAREGLLSEMTYAWAGTTPALTQLIHQNKIRAWNLPYGCVSQMIRDCGAGRVGPLTKIGTGTFADPSETGGKKNALTKEERVRVVELNGERLLWYQAPKKIDMGLLRGTTADVDGNISFEKEALLLDTLLKAIAVHNSGGTVIVQVERVVERYTLPTRRIHIPGPLVDKIVVVSDPRWHLQTFNFDHYDPSLSGEWRVPLDRSKPPELNERKIIAHRAFFEITKPHCVVNLGVGMPEGVAVMAGQYTEQNPAAASVVLTTEAGVLGGFPCGGIRFGTAQNPTAHLPSDTILDFYNGGGIDVAFLGMAEVDAEGNVNVSDFGAGRMPGCGGFIDISQSAKRVIFMGCHTSSGLKISVQSRQLEITHEGCQTKFRRQIKEKTFAAASSGGRSILYVTERAVFRLKPDCGLELIEIAPGVKLDTVLGSMEFRPTVASPLKAMDSRIFG